jgi:hypothetical protein
MSKGDQINKAENMCKITANKNKVAAKKLLTSVEKRRGY